MSIALSHRWSLKQALPWLAVGLGASIAAATVMHDRLFHTNSATSSARAKGPEPAPSANTVTLTAGKLREGKIASTPAALVSLPVELSVAGRIEPNTDRRVEVRPRASGVVRKVHVALGRKVRKGEPLVTLDSADVGTARLNLRAKQRDLAIARVEADWRDQVARNVERLIPELRKNVPAATLEKQYADRPLGANRATLLQAYAELEIASHEEEKTSGLFKQKIVGEHPAFLAMHTRESAQAKFEAALEQVRFDAAQQKRVVDQQVRVAEATVIDAAQRLRILGVSEDMKSLLAKSTEIISAAPDEDVTAYEIVAPFDGTIIEKTAVPSQRAEPTDRLFVLADLSNVWVTASVIESDFAALPLLREGKIRLTAAAYPDRTFEARLLSIGASVDPTTRAVPLTAETDNPDDMLRLGMFVRIVIDTARAGEALTVPLSAVVEIDGKKGVFLPDANDEHVFTFHPVKIDREAGDRAVIASGLKAGERVVSAGAFLLKSELILRNQTDED